MRVKNLKINNFKAIENFEVENLQDFIVIAGPNGCGKTTVLDALRLLKSVYVSDEWGRWLSEFGISIDVPSSFLRMLRNKTKPARIEAKFSLSDAEREFVLNHVDGICLSLVLKKFTDNRINVTGETPVFPPNFQQSEKNRFLDLSKEKTLLLKKHLDESSEFSTGIEVTPEPLMNIDPSPVAEAVFSCFRPDSIGEVEFHSSRRLFFRESVNNIRLNLDDRTEERKNRFLYDLENKYKNVKTQLGEEYVASVLKGSEPDDAPLQKSIKELFGGFFPGKEFLGVRVTPDNKLEFPVRLDTGETHDIDELSSGEKEIVYGYLWLRTGTPRRSIVLVDEPELHLNPALVQGLPSFYKINLAEALDSQVWIVTHSDVILRQAVRSPQMTVYHMARARGDNTQQALAISSQDSIEAAVIDLIGDLAAYRPYAKIVLVEGNKETRFDIDVIRRLFPDYAERANFISVGSRAMTSGVRTRLTEVLLESGLSGRAVSISDGDLGWPVHENEEDVEHFRWPVYEVENFLLIPEVIIGATNTMLRKNIFHDERDVIEQLRDIDSNLVDNLANVEVQRALNSEFLKSIKIRGSGEKPILELIRSSQDSADRISGIDIGQPRIEELISECSRRYRGYVENGEFLTRFPGDRLLRGLAGKAGVNGDHFRNICLDQAQRLQIRPPGMEEILRRALE